MPLVYDHPIEGLRGAEYNPRRIDQADLDRLAESIKELGIVKPLIARGDLLVAGHQRTRALRQLGHKTAPVYLLPAATTLYDEIRFNQLHNGTDMDCGEENAVIAGGFLKTGFHTVAPGSITGNFRCKMAAVRKEICDLITGFGPWGAVVATRTGRVIHCAQYALAAALCRVPLTCFVIEDEDEPRYRSYLDRTYGVFSYDGLERDTYIQTLAQLPRLRDGGGAKKANRSTLYEGHVIPWLEKHKGARGIDFGSGWGDYAAAMRRRGYALHDVELFRRARSRNALDATAIRSMIETMATDLEEHGQYDFVVCDSVLNSVDSLEAEAGVMTMLNALCRVGGRLFFSGRKSERLESMGRHTKSISANRYIEFTDEHGMTALYRKGSWFYQKFHTQADVEKLAASHGLRLDKHVRGASTTSWQVEAVKLEDLPFTSYVNASKFEFEQRLGKDGEVIGMSERVIKAIEAALCRS